MGGFILTFPWQPANPNSAKCPLLNQIELKGRFLLPLSAQPECDHDPR